jgi:hypothetical protein
MFHSSSDGALIFLSKIETSPAVRFANATATYYLKGFTFLLFLHFAINVIGL